MSYRPLVPASRPLNLGSCCRQMRLFGMWQLPKFCKLTNHQMRLPSKCNGKSFLRYPRAHWIDRITPLPATGSAESARPSLSHLCMEIQHGFFELCVQNNGRSAAAALTQVVAAAVAAFEAGYHLDRLRLELEHGPQAQEGRVDSAGWRLTNGEQSYRSQWLDLVYITLQLDKGVFFEHGTGVDALASQTALRPQEVGDEALVATIRHTLRGHYSGNQGAVKFDRSLATTGASGGVAADARTLPPQFVPMSQLVLLTLKMSRRHT